MQSAVIGSVCDLIYGGDIENQPNGTAEHNYCVEYAGNVVQILEGERVWYNNKGRIIIGWHGSYSPPHGM